MVLQLGLDIRDTIGNYIALNQGKGIKYYEGFMQGKYDKQNSYETGILLNSMPKNVKNRRCPNLLQSLTCFSFRSSNGIWHIIMSVRIRYVGTYSGGTIPMILPIACYLSSFSSFFD